MTLRNIIPHWSFIKQFRAEVMVQQLVKPASLLEFKFQDTENSSSFKDGRLFPGFCGHLSAYGIDSHKNTHINNNKSLKILFKSLNIFFLPGGGGTKL